MGIQESGTDAPEADETLTAGTRVLFTARPDQTEVDQAEVYSTSEDDVEEGYPVGIEIHSDTPTMQQVLIHADDVHAFAAALLQVDPTRVVVLPEVAVERHSSGNIVHVDGHPDLVVATRRATPEYMRGLVEMSERTLATRRAVLALLLDEASPSQAEEVSRG